MMQKTNNKILT